MQQDWQNKGFLSPIIRFTALFVGYLILKPLIKFMEMTGHYQWLHRTTIQISRRVKHSSFDDYQATENDILVCCYSKSGTNWTMQIAYQITHYGEGEFEHIHHVIPWPDGFPNMVSIHDPTPLENSPTGLRVIKTHLNWDKVPYNPDAHYICVIRDPKDVFVSSYFFVKDVGLGVAMPSPKSWLDTFLSDEFMMDSWPEHTAGYWANRHRDNVLVLTFAEMKAELPTTVERIADFIGVELSPEICEQVVKKSSFEYMKSIDHKFYPGLVSPLAEGKGRMMRKGKRGSSNELLSGEEQKRIDNYMRAKLQELGSDFPYDEMFTT